MSGLLRIRAVKWLWGAAALSVVAVAGSLLLTAGDDPRAGSGPQPFYLEAEVTVVDRSSTAGTSLPPSEEVRTSALRWWHRDATHARWELPGFMGVLDGRDLWFYDEEQNSYASQPLPDFPAGTVTAGIPISILLGPANAADRGDFIQQLRDRGADSVSVVGKEKVLGRRVTVIEARPASRSESQTSSSSGASTPTVAAHGTVRYWLDEERMFVLRYEVRDDVQDVTAVVTRLDYPADIPDAVVTFEPPAGAVEAIPE